MKAKILNAEQVCPNVDPLSGIKMTENEHLYLGTIFYEYANLRGRVRHCSHTEVVDERDNFTRYKRTWEFMNEHCDFKSFSLWEKFSDMQRIFNCISWNQYLRHVWIDDECRVYALGSSTSTDGVVEIMNAAVKVPLLNKLHHVILADNGECEWLQ